MLTLQPQEINDIVNSLTTKAAADRTEARKLLDPGTGLPFPDFQCLYDELYAQAAREDALADKLLDHSLAEVLPC